MRKLFISTLAVAGCLLPIGFASAQDAPKPPPAVTAPAKSGKPHRMPLTKRVAAHLLKLKADLKITKAQEHKWKTYADVVIAQVADMQKMSEDMRAKRKAHRSNPPTAIERLQLRETILKQKAASMAEIIKVASPLYDSLSPEQKPVADRELARMAGRYRRSHNHKGPASPDVRKAP